MTYTLRTVTASDIIAATHELEPIYRSCFSEPPWNPAEEKFDEWPAKLRTQMTQPGAGGILGHKDGKLCGAVYGWPAPQAMPTGTPFNDALLAATPQHLIPRLTAPATIVVELMVDPAHRRRGLAAALLTSYVPPGRSGWLCTHPDAPAAKLYHKLGWHAAIEFSTGTTPLVVYLHP